MDHWQNVCLAHGLHVTQALNQVNLFYTMYCIQGTSSESTPEASGKLNSINIKLVGRNPISQEESISM